MTAELGERKALSDCQYMDPVKAAQQKLHHKEAVTESPKTEKQEAVVLELYAHLPCLKCGMP